ncbi:hypothetical protein LCGC14_2394180 [marine sediment metagenome]|uniref:Uncharacterized protein n=1 Tax=marine sediment metagenome TaxID=412755 RepID=A0A0F9CJC2_9ZZZZ
MDQTTATNKLTPDTRLFPPDYRGKYPHMFPRDVLVWERFLGTFGSLYNEFAYDVRVGEKTWVNPRWEENYKKDAQILSQLRIDAVGFKDSAVEIIEEDMREMDLNDIMKWFKESELFKTSHKIPIDGVDEETKEDKKDNTGTINPARADIMIDMSTLELVTLMAEGNQGALNTLTKIMTVDGLDDFFELILNLDDMNIRGEQIWVAYTDHAMMNADKLKACARNRCPVMIDVVNRRCSVRHIAVVRGASVKRFDKNEA